MSNRRGGRFNRPTETIRGVFTDFRVHTHDGWGSGHVQPHGGGDPISVTGTIVGGRPGDTVEIQGWWREHPTYGRQFTVVSCAATLPQSTDAVIAWMASHFPGVGKSRAAAMLARFGGPSELWRVIEDSPERLAEIQGITVDTARDIQRVYTELSTERDHMIVLRGWGLTDKQIERCRTEWQTIPNVVAQIRTDPYSLCGTVAGFGFKRADAVALRMGIAPDAVERLAACAVYVLDQAIQDGHCFLWGGQLQRMAATLLGVDPAAAGRGIGEAWRRGQLTRRGKRVYAPRLEAAETDCAREISRLLYTDTSPFKKGASEHVYN